MSSNLSRYFHLLEVNKKKQPPKKSDEDDPDKDDEDLSDDEDKDDSDEQKAADKEGDDKKPAKTDDDEGNNQPPKKKTNNQPPKAKKGSKGDDVSVEVNVDTDDDESDDKDSKKANTPAKPEKKKHTSPKPSTTKTDKPKKEKPVPSNNNKIDIDPELNEESELDEALNRQQRRQRAIAMRKNKHKIAAGRRRNKNRRASPDKLKGRAKKKAIATMRDRILGGKKSYGELSPNEKEIVDKKVAKRKSAVNRLATRLLPKVRKAEMDKKSGRKVAKEEVNLLAEQFLEGRHHEMRNKDGSMKYDKRFKMYRKKTDESLDEGRLGQANIDAAKALSKRKRLGQANIDAAKALSKRKRLGQANIDAAKALAAKKRMSEDIDLSAIEELYDAASNEKLIENLEKKAEKNNIEPSRVIGMFEAALNAWKDIDTEQSPVQFAMHFVDTTLAERVSPEVVSRLKQKQDNKFADRIMSAMVKRMKVGGDKQSVEGAAYDVSKEFNLDLSPRDLAKRYMEYSKGGFRMNEANEEGCPETTKKFKKMTPGQGDPLEESREYDERVQNVVNRINRNEESITKDQLERLVMRHGEGNYELRMKGRSRNDFIKDVGKKLKFKSAAQIRREEEKEKKALFNKNLQRGMDIIYDGISNSFPDGDPFDHIAPRIMRLFNVGMSDVIGILDQIIKKHERSVKSYHDFLAMLWDDQYGDRTAERERILAALEKRPDDKSLQRALKDVESMMDAYGGTKARNPWK